MNHERRNALAGETSPYLLQHAANPVDWQPWNDKALKQARREDKPILLSVGYSACHWCHVMEHESFEDEETAALMNRLFVNIKVDREERPDVDSIYMNYVQMTTGSGGWPLTVFLTPDLIPFFGGTYFPPDERYGRPGFKRVLERVSDAYHQRRDEIDAMSDDVVRRLEESTRLATAEGALSRDLLTQAALELARHHDPRFGGFGSAPKFPSAMVLSFLLRFHSREESKSALEMVETSLREMSRGGLYDWLGGGFHRYSVDDRWLVPHFEKMLYDNALLARLYLEAHLLTGDESHRRIAEQTIEYVLREMTHEEGGFFSSQDADSEGEEGKFYVWSYDEVGRILGSDAEWFRDLMDVTPSGNFEGHNILHQRYDLEGFSRQAGLSVEEIGSGLEKCRQSLLEARGKRVWPGRDDKILTSWNGMMLAAISEAAFLLDRPDFLEAANRNAEFLLANLIVDGRLHRSWKEGRARFNAYLEDYACLVEGLLNLFEAGGEIRWLREAERLTRQQLELFWDEEGGDFYFTSSDHEKLLLRQKEFMDNATPSGNSTACANLLRLSVLVGRAEYREKAERMLRRLTVALSRHPLGFGRWLQALDFALGPVDELVVLGPETERGKLLRPLRKRFLPNRVLVQQETSAEHETVPLLQGKQLQKGRATAFVCRDYACRQPVTSAGDLEEQLGQ